MIKTVLITRFGEITEININPQEKNLELYFKNKGVSQCKELNQWENGDAVIHLYGYTSGRESKINKHELPPPVDMNLFFGDLLVLKKNKKKILENFTKKDYKCFWNNAFNGFEYLDDSRIEDDEEIYGDNDDYDYEDSFIVDDR